VDDLFTVRQGIRTGANEVFIQPPSTVRSLPINEQRYFREAVDAASFVQGEIESVNFLFVPDQSWLSESDVANAIPQFFRVHLLPNKESLLRRKRKSMDTSRWWELTWPRSWAFDERPRLVSKRFGLYPAFARDFETRFAIVQANAWVPTEKVTPGRRGDAVRELLTAYWWLLNSRIAVALFREFCPNVAGGQLDLEHKYVKDVPMPNLALRFEEDTGLQLLASSIKTRNGDCLPPVEERDRFAAVAFRTTVSAWNIIGLESAD
jgi:hypothetical protein